MFDQYPTVQSAAGLLDSLPEIYETVMYTMLYAPDKVQLVDCMYSSSVQTATTCYKMQIEFSLIFVVLSLKESNQRLEVFLRAAAVIDDSHSCNPCNSKSTKSLWNLPHV